MRHCHLITICVLSALAAFGQGNITTTAGTGACAYGGDQGQAVQATLCNPQGAVADAAGNVYFADSTNWRVRQIAANGVITTIAGNGTRGTSGDGGPAISASIGMVTHLAYDGLGHVCFGDQDAYKVRCVFLSSGMIAGYGSGGSISSGDGGPFPNASFSRLSGIEFVLRYQSPNVFSDLYIVDGDSAVRRVDGATGIISTVVGPGQTTILGDGGPGTAASLAGPEGLRYWNNAIYIADTYHHRIRKLDLATGIITTAVGDGIPSFFGDGGPATQASITSPGHIVFDPLGNMFLTDRGNMRVRKVDLSGTISTFAGDGTTGVGPDNVPPTQTDFNGLNGLAWNPVTNGLVIADGSNRLREVPPNSASTTNLTVSPNPATSGSALTLTATITPAVASGNVSFFNGSAVIGTSVLSNGVATFSWNPPSSGTFQLSATYNGEAHYASSTSATVNAVVQSASTTTTIASNPNPCVQGQTALFTATVTPAAASGTVQFMTSNQVVLGTAPLVNGIARFTTTTLPAGSTMIFASYLGDGTYNSSASSPITQVIQATTTTGLSIVPATASYGSPVSIVAQVTPSSATGTVQFSSGSSFLASATLDSGGYARLTLTILSVGTNSITAGYLGDSNNSLSISSAVVVTITKASTTTTLSVNPTTSTFGQAVTLNASVTPPLATGIVQFFNGSTSLGSAVIANNLAQIITTALPVGANSLTAVYSGDANALTSTSAAVVQTVSKAASTTTLSASPAPSTSGQSVTLTAAVTPTGATGTVQFFSGSTSLGSATITSGQAQLATTALPVGTDSLTAVYSGDSNTAGSTSAAVAQTVSLVSTATALTSSPNPSILGASVTLNATVSPAGATGAVQFLNGATLLGSANLSGGQAQFATTTLPAGTNTLTATYTGDTNNATSTSGAVQQIVNKLTSTTGLASSANPITLGGSVTFTASVSPADATGTVLFVTIAAGNPSTLGSAAIIGGVATLTTSALSSGPNTVTAQYSGDARYNGSTSSAVNEMVRFTSYTVLSTNPNPSVFGGAVVLTANIYPANNGQTGSVQFLNGSVVLGSATLNAGGQAQLTTTALPLGTDSLTASYSGDTYWANSTTSATLTVNKPGTTTSLASSANPITLGGSVTFTATVSPSDATGTVQFVTIDSGNATTLGSAAVIGGVATLTTSALASGLNTVTAQHSGDARYNGSTSSPVNEMVRFTSYTVLSTSPNPSVSGGAVVLTANIYPANSGQTGSVQFFNGSAVLGSATLNASGQAQFTTNALPLGTDSLTASYSGDTYWANSTSAAIQQTVNKPSTTTSLSGSPNPSVWGASVTLTATVSPSSATGPVQFLNGSTLLGSANLTGGQAQFSTTALPVGTDSLTAIYSGDANNSGSTSSAIPLTVNKANTSATLAANPSPSTVGQAVTLTSTVAPSSATGLVQFFNGSTVMGTANVSGGQAQFTTTALPAGTNSLTAVYSGDTNYSNATSAAIAQTVTKTATATTVTSSQNPLIAGGGVLFSAAVTPSTATGTVQFLDGTTVLGTGTLGGGTASFGTSTLTQGTHSITAVYSGDAANTGSTSAVLSQSVKLYAGLTMGISPSPAAVGQTVIITATMNSAATGTVKFTDGSAVLATVPVSAGVASYSTSSLTAGSHTLGIGYSGDTTYVTTSASFNETVLVASSVVLQSNANPTTVGQSITFTAVVTPTSATGTVQFFDGGTLIATAPDVGGLATFSTASFAKGSHSVTAIYSGDAANSQAFSAPLTEIVRAITSVSLASSANPSTVGQSVTFSASLSSSTATGTVQFIDGATVLSTVTVNSGSAMFTTSQLGAGVHSMTVLYSGDNSDTAVTSAVLTQTVNVPPPAAPSNLTATAAGSSQINLAWMASPTSGVTYTVYGSTSSGITPSASNRIASGVASTTYPAAGLSASTAYYYRVTAVNAGGESAATNQASATTAGVLACHVRYSVTNQWNNGFTGAISIKNTGATPINSWTLTWTWPGNQRVTQSWSANSSQSGANVTFTNMSYNATIAPGATLTGVGFNASYSGSNPAPGAFSVNGTPCH